MILRIYRDKQWFVADFSGAIFSSMSLGMILNDLGSFEHYADDMYPDFEYHSLHRSREHVKTVCEQQSFLSLFLYSKSSHFKLNNVQEYYNPMDNL